MNIIGSDMELNTLLIGIIVALIGAFWVRHEVYLKEKSKARDKQNDVINGKIDNLVTEIRQTRESSDKKWNEALRRLDNHELRLGNLEKPK